MKMKAPLSLRKPLLYYLLKGDDTLHKNNFIKAENKRFVLLIFHALNDDIKGNDNYLV